MVAILLKYENKDLHNEFTGVSNLTKDNTTTTTNFRSYKIIYVWFINHVAIKLEEMGVFRISIIHFKDNNSRMDHLLSVWFYVNCVLCFSFLSFTYWQKGGLIINEIFKMDLELYHDKESNSQECNHIIDMKMWYSWCLKCLSTAIFYQMINTKWLCSK